MVGTAKPQIHKARGVAKYPYLNRPDTKFNKNGVFKVDLIVSEDYSEPVTKIIAEQLKEAEKEAKKKAAEQRKKGKKVEPKVADMPYYEECDEDGNETGNVVFRFKSTASGTDKNGKKWKRKLSVFDAKGKPSKAQIYGGSTLVIAFTAKPWVNPKLEYGVKLQIEGVKIIDLVTGGQRSATSLGLDDEEDGYTADGEADDESDEEDEEDDDTEDDDDDATDDEDDEPF